VKEPVVERRPDGLRLHGLPPVLAAAMRTLPDLLGPDGPAGDGRCRQDPFPAADVAARDEWRRLAWPELRHLFESRRATVARDVEGMVEERPGPRPRYRLDIPSAHVNAWLSALSGARVGLAEAHGIGAEDMTREPKGPPKTDRDRALWTVRVLGWAQSLILEGIGITG
jgi:hypothetical protein